MLVFGTRPEAIKMCPLVLELKSRPSLETIVCVTGQHREMLDQVLQAFNVKPDFDLVIMEKNQTLFDVTTNILNKIKAVLLEVKPDVVLVHGDTSTTFGHRFGLLLSADPRRSCRSRTEDQKISIRLFLKNSTVRAVGLIARYHFAPTQAAKENLVNEGKDPSTVYCHRQHSH